MRLFLQILFAILFFISCRTLQVNQLESIHYETTKVKDDSLIATIIQPYKNDMNNKMGETIGYSEIAMTKDQPEGILGNFVADCLFYMSKIYLGKDSSEVDMVLLNNGGLRASLPAGEIKLSNIFELMPFDNQLTIVELSGEQCEKMFLFIAEKGGVPVSNIQMQIKDGKPDSIFVGRNVFDKNKSYKVLSSDYLIAGGDKMNFFKEVKNTFPLNVLIRDAIKDYFKLMEEKKIKINPTLDGRISISK